MTSPLTTELIVMGCSFGLFLAHMTVQASLALRDRGMAFNAGPRDDPNPLGRLACRAERALANFKETWPILIALALGLAVTGRSGGIGATGAWIWLAARAAYLPLYLMGIPYLRTLCWGVATAGLVMMGLKLFF